VKQKYLTSLEIKWLLEKSKEEIGNYKWFSSIFRVSRVLGNSDGLRRCIY
jgi:hypothetical protein